MYKKGPGRAEEDVEEFISQSLRGAGLQAARPVSQPKRQRKLCTVSPELQSTVHPADRDHRALTQDREGLFLKRRSGLMLISVQQRFKVLLKDTYRHIVRC